jgi:hypothetical protein
MMLVYDTVKDGARISKFGLDIDVDYTEFMNSYRVIGICDRLRSIFAPGVRAWTRRSANGRTHVKVEIEQPITLFESLMIRAFLFDDSGRLARDLARYWEFRDIGNTGRLFDEKLVGGALKKAGDWEDLQL